MSASPQRVDSRRSLRKLGSTARMGMNGVSTDKHVRYRSMARCEKDAEGLHVRRLNPSRIAAQDPATERVGKVKSFD
jgi:hypothetical protein